MTSNRRKKKALESLPDDPDERWDVVTATLFQTIREAFAELGYGDGKIVLMLEEGDRQAVLGGGFEDKPDGFAFIREMATAYAEAVGIKMIATRATGPIAEGQG